MDLLDAIWQKTSEPPPVKSVVRWQDDWQKTNTTPPLSDSIIWNYWREEAQRSLCTHGAHQSASPCRRPLAPSRWAWPSGRCSTCSPGNSVPHHRSVEDTEDFQTSFALLLHPNPSGAAHANSPCWFGRKINTGGCAGRDGKHRLLLMRFSHLCHARTDPVQYKRAETRM